MAQSGELQLSGPLLVPGMALSDRDEHLPRCPAQQTAASASLAVGPWDGPALAGPASGRPAVAAAVPRPAAGGIAPLEDEPDAVVVARETIEIAFLAAIQLLPPRQRAALIMRDVLGWSARETASLLDASVASVNSALQRARDTLKKHLPPRRLEWAPSSAPSEEERAVLRRFMEALERADADAFVALLREDARATMPPIPSWHDGREAIATAVAQSVAPGSPEHMGRWRLVPTGANRQPAAAAYLQRPGGSEYRAFALDVLRVEEGKVAEITAFLQPRAEAGEFRIEPGWDLFGAFGLPLTL
jgi:RNA polymerase sigma-70 factor, ECF subfamily